MDVVLYKSESRGAANYGWLNTRYTFSFANYYCPSRLNFGALRVLNDDIVQPKMGFGTHPHDNMEIITIVHEGELEHKDSMGNGSVIHKGEVQVMSAGSGITHSEFNPSDDEMVSLFQIWLFPNKKNVKPRYDQVSLKEDELDNTWRTIVSPDGADNSMKIHQDAWMLLGNFNAGQTVEYQPKVSSNGIFLMVVNGEAAIENYTLSKRDAAGFSGVDGLLQIEIKAQSNLLLLEVPMIELA
jgi:hypothetical protein